MSIIEDQIERPAPLLLARPTVGVAIIAKNEEAMIARCLNSVKDADEIVVVDTGSLPVDHTMQIARRYTQRVYSDFEWCKDFAAARNHVLRKMTTDWVFSIDCDEFCHDFSKVREAVAEAAEIINPDGSLVDAINIMQYGEGSTVYNLFPRLFRNSPEVWWVGRAHNHLNVTGKDFGVVAITYGHSPAHRLDPNRTMDILEDVVKRPPPTREMFYLAREYAYRNRHEDCIATLLPYSEHSVHMAEKAEAFLMMAQSYVALADWEKARLSCLKALMINAHFKEALLYMAWLAGDGSEVEKFRKNAEQWKRLAAAADNSGVLFVRT